MPQSYTPEFKKKIVRLHERKVVPTKASPLSMGYRKPAFLSGVASLVKNASQARKPKKIMTT